jgi:hypothetical protein
MIEDMHLLKLEALFVTLFLYLGLQVAIIFYKGKQTPRFLGVSPTALEAIDNTMYHAFQRAT